MIASERAESYDPSFREQSVDDALDDHDTRIRRLEKAALLGAGYGIAEGGNLVTELLGFF